MLEILSVLHRYLDKAVSLERLLLYSKGILALVSARLVAGEATLPVSPLGGRRRRLLRKPEGDEREVPCLWFWWEGVVLGVAATSTVSLSLLPVLDEEGKCNGSVFVDLLERRPAIGWLGVPPSVSVCEAASSLVVEHATPGTGSIGPECSTSVPRSIGDVPMSAKLVPRSVASCPPFDISRR